MGVISSATLSRGLVPVLLVLAACGGRSLAGDSAPSGAGMGAASGGGNDGNTPLGGAAGNGAPNAGGGAGHTACSSEADCLLLRNPCAYATCTSGQCGIAYVARGAMATRNSPADCHASACDGAGSTQQVIDVGNVPPSVSACTRVDCDPTSGNPISNYLVAGADCTASGQGNDCDGKGNCVACLADADCAPSQRCVLHECTAPTSCSDGRKAQDETDVDCGGSCPPCAVTADCNVNRDCASHACDAWAPHRCQADHCADHGTDSDETDVDCGGSCAPCEEGFHCQLDQDCQSSNCDLTRGTHCLAVHCTDGISNFGEVDVDCGGGCAWCGLGKHCETSFDCASAACDVVNQVCVADHCRDHYRDADETGIDCGGPNACPRCPMYTRCIVDSDCMPGHACSQTVPHQCQ